MLLLPRNVARPVIAGLALTGACVGIAAVTQLGSAQATPCRAPSAPDPTVIDIIRREGVVRDVSPRVMLAAMEAAKVESNFNNVPCGDRDSLGVFQQRASWGSAAERLNPVVAAAKFFGSAMALDARLPADLSAGRLAQKVQRSAYPGRYDQASTAATQLLDQANSKAHTNRTLVNGGFEQGSQGWAAANGPIDFYAYRDPSKAHSGNGYLEVNATQAGQSIATTVSGDPHGNRTLTVWARCRAARCDGVLDLWALGPNQAAAKAFSVGTTWTQLTVTRWAVPGTTALRAEVYMTSTGVNMDLDDATLTLPARVPN